MNGKSIFYRPVSCNCIRCIKSKFRNCERRQFLFAKKWIKLLRIPDHPKYCDLLKNYRNDDNDSVMS